MFDKDKTLPVPLTEEQEKELGITTQYGVKFDKDGNMLEVSKPQL